MSTLHIALATSGLPKSSGAMPFICRIAAALVNDTGETTDSYCTTIRAEEGKRIEPEATRRHGITSLMCQTGGVAERLALGIVLGFQASGAKRPVALPGLAASARTIVAWDADFTRAVLNDRYARHGEPHDSWRRPGLQFVGLQDICTPFCQLPDPKSETGSYRKPTRDEAALALASLPMRDFPHSAEDDLRVQIAVWSSLSQRGAFDMGEAA